VRLQQDPEVARYWAKRAADRERSRQAAWEQELRAVALRDAAGVPTLVVPPEPDPPPEIDSFHAWLARRWPWKGSE